MTDIRPEPDRDRWGRYLIVPANGGKARSYTRATTIADTLDDRHNLEKWMQRMVALGLTQRPDLYASVAARKPDEKAELDKLCDQAREAAKGSAGANLGTALHRFVERVNHGEEVNVPAPWDADIAAYTATMKAQRFLIDRRYLEGVVVLEEIQVAGTFDMIVNARIADLKTGANLDWSWRAIAVQLALYAHADTLYDITTKTHTPMPAVDQDVALVIHLPAGQACCTLYEVDIAAGWEAAQHALWARGWRKRKDLATPTVASVGGGESTPASHPVEQTAPAGKKRSFGDEVRARTKTEPPEPPADPDAVAALERRHAKLSGVAKAWIDGIYAQAAGYHLNPPATVRKLEIARAMVRFAELDPDRRLLRGAIDLVLGEEQQQSIPLGVLIATLTMSQIEALNGIALAIHDGRRAVIYTADSAQLPAA